MTTQLIIFTLTTIAAFAAGALWMLRPRRRIALASAQTAQLEDMYVYTMQDDPC